MTHDLPDGPERQRRLRTEEHCQRSTIIGVDQHEERPRCEDGHLETEALLRPWKCHLMHLDSGHKDDQGNGHCLPGAVTEWPDEQAEVGLEGEGGDGKDFFVESGGEEVDEIVPFKVVQPMAGIRKNERVCMAVAFSLLDR